jgi:hypothetical protein
MVYGQYFFHMTCVMLLYQYWTKKCYGHVKYIVIKLDSID